MIEKMKATIDKGFTWDLKILKNLLNYASTNETGFTSEDVDNADSILEKLSNKLYIPNVGEATKYRLDSSKPEDKKENLELNIGCHIQAFIADMKYIREKVAIGEIVYPTKFMLPNVEGAILLCEDYKRLQNN